MLRYEDQEFSGIFTGDISSAEEQYLVEHKKVGSVTFYKAAHHGSRYSNSRDFLMALSPEITTISCGENNRYGHPGEEALCNIKESGSAVYETMECGRIRIRMENGNLWWKNSLKEDELFYIMGKEFIDNCETHESVN